MSLSLSLFLCESVEQPVQVDTNYKACIIRRMSSAPLEAVYIENGFFYETNINRDG